MHVLGDDIGLLSRKRDAFDPFTGMQNPPRLASWDDLVSFLNKSNALWVQATRRMSHQLACTFLALTGEEPFQKGTFQGNVQLARKVLDTIAIIA